MFDVLKTIDLHVKDGKMNAEDLKFYANEKPSASGALLFGAVGAIIAQSATAKYVGSFNENEITLWIVSNAGTPTWRKISFLFSDIIAAKVSGFWGSYTIRLFYGPKQYFDFVLPKRFRKFPDQLVSYNTIRNFLRTKYPKK